MDLKQLSQRLSAAKVQVEARGETFYPGPSRTQLGAYPPKERWDDWVELDSKAWPRRQERRYMLVPTTCFNCESACGLLAYVDRDTLEVRKLEGNPEHPGSRVTAGHSPAENPWLVKSIASKKGITAVTIVSTDERPSPGIRVRELASWMVAPLAALAARRR